MSKQIDKFKFILLMVLIVFLYQIPCLIEDYLYYPYALLTIGVWILETRNITRDSSFRRKVMYVFPIFWCIIFFMLITMNVGYLFEDFWIGSPISIYIVSKIFTQVAKKDKIQEKDEFFSILSIIMLVVGMILAYLIYEHIFSAGFPDVEYNLYGDVIFNHYKDTFIRNFKYNYFYCTTI